MNRSIRSIVTGVVLLVLVSPAKAQDRWAVGLGVELAPTFPSASDDSAAPTPLVDRLKDGESLYADLKSGPRIGLVEAEDFEAGFALNFDAGRNADDLPSLLRGLGEVGAAVELGGYAAWSFAPFAVRLDLLTDVADGHGGLTASPSLEWFSDPEGRLRFNARIGFDWANRAYLESYFGVDATQAALTGLSTYKPDAGFVRSLVRLGFAYDLNSQWAMVGSAGFSRWIGDAGDSPITRLGDDDYVSTRIGVMYVW